MLRFHFPIVIIDEDFRSENTSGLGLHAALKKHHVATEYLELPEGGHGLNGYKGPMWDAWQTKSLEWLATLKVIPLSDATDAVSN